MNHVKFNFLGVLLAACIGLSATDAHAKPDFGEVAVGPVCQRFLGSSSVVRLPAGLGRTIGSVAGGAAGAVIGLPLGLIGGVMYAAEFGPGSLLFGPVFGAMVVGRLGSGTLGNGGCILLGGPTSVLNM